MDGGGSRHLEAGTCFSARRPFTKSRNRAYSTEQRGMKNSIPAIGNEFIINIKDSSVLSVIGCMDLMYATTSVSGIYFKALETYCIAAVFYLILTYFSSLLMKSISRKLDTAVKEIPSSN